MSKLIRCILCDATGVECEYDNQIGKWNIQTLKILIWKVTNPIRRAKLIARYRILKKKGRIPCARCKGRGYTLQREKESDL